MILIKIFDENIRQSVLVAKPSCVYSDNYTPKAFTKRDAEHVVYVETGRKVIACHGLMTNHCPECKL